MDPNQIALAMGFMPRGPGRRRHDLTIGDKREIIRLLDLRTSQTDIARVYKCSQSQISRMAAKREEIIAEFEKCDDPVQKTCRYDTAVLASRSGTGRGW